MLRFNTAIFYDVENLTQGNNFSKNFIQNFSLKPIYQQILDLPIVDHIALQRAYGNWSDARLSVLRGEINELGIDPIQIFGFARHHIKNAADIQLAVDAMDITLTRSHIDVYVIVSGDGGFASLAKKLHEYGRQVVGCAYGTATNDILRSVCDAFVELPSPYEVTVTPVLREKGKVNDKGLGVGITHSLVLALAETLTPLEIEIRSDGALPKGKVLAQSERIMHWFSTDSEARHLISQGGIHLSVIREAFKYGIPSFKAEQMGFGKFAEFLQFICRDKDVCVGMTPPTNYLLISRFYPPRNTILLPDVYPEDLHRNDRYQNLLASGKPRIVIPPPDDFTTIIQAFYPLNPQSLGLNTVVELLSQVLPQFERDLLNTVCITLIQCQILQGNFPQKPLAEQLFSLAKQVVDDRTIALHSPEDIIQAVRDQGETKLRSILQEDFQPQVFATLFPMASQ